MKSFNERKARQPDESELSDLARKVFLEAFPNSTRIDCPNSAVREALASGKQNLAEHWDVFDHICICSPCFAEYLAARKRGSRRARIQLALGIAVLAAVSVVGYATLGMFSDTVSLLSTAELRKAIPPLPSPPPNAVVKSATIAVLNFRHWSVGRGVGEVQPPHKAPGLKRGRLSIRIELPLFSPAGEYRVSLRTGTDKPWIDQLTVARIIGGRTVVDPVGIDLSSAGPGLYTLSLETTGLRPPLQFPIHLE